MRLFTTGEVASMLKTSVQMTRRMINRGDIPAVKIGRRWYVPEARFNELIGVSNNENDR
ncbi:helix-turn-helix domain-containing protein [Slackia isoflavoniconvertens]|uniref:helix-turn-helix domain-containing protein n=1 Tax=Slackia isoflavoniconvertens TaxID=572010 RepID=UPI0039B069C3